MECKLPQMGRCPDETRRISRVLQMLNLIAVKPRRYLRRELAEKFEVSERMIEKDLDLIRHGMKLSLLHSSMDFHSDQMGNQRVGEPTPLQISVSILQ
jgi:predicted DNA-binding transcriptional regulator YafY